MIIYREMPQLRAGPLKPTLVSLQEAVLREPEDADANHALGSRLERRGEHHRALPYLERALASGGQRREYFEDSGKCLLSVGRPSDAARTFEAGLHLHPDWAGGFRRLGLICGSSLGDAQAAIRCFTRSVAAGPEHLDNWAALAGCFVTNRRAAEAMREVERLVPTDAGPSVAKGVARALGRAGRYPEAMQIMLALLPNLESETETLGMIADFAQVMHDWDTATEFHNRALRNDPRHAINCFYYWVKIDAPDRAAAALKLRSDTELLRWGPEDEYAFPTWKGEHLDGRRVLFHTADFGAGDALQFCRFARPFQERGATVFAECSLALTSLISTVPGTEAAFGRFEQAPDIDFEFDAFFDLCLLLKKSARSIGALVPYFFPDPARVQRFRKLIGTPGSLRVGLNWAGSRWWTDDKYSCRSMRLAELAPLGEIPGLSFYSLQKGPGAGELSDAPAPFPIVDLGTHCADFEDTAAAMNSMDLVISVDTSVAHLAGGLGMRAYVLLPFNACFRWGVERSDCDWYPSMTLIRQTHPGAWKHPVQELTRILRDLARQASQQMELAQTA